ncbi:MAG: hypothetical protein WBE13_06805 [Candidatus Acidiferrum sp.]
MLQNISRNITLSRTAKPLAFITLVLVAAVAAAAVSPQALSSTPSPHWQSSASSDDPQTEPRLANTATREGPFTIGTQEYTVLLQDKELMEDPSHAQSSADSEATLWRLEILNARGNPVYQETFPYNIEQRRFKETLSASSSLLPGTGGIALVIRFLGRPAPSPDAKSPVAKESWQVFGIVNGHLAPFGAVLPLGRGTDITVGGTLAAVMIKGGVELMPMASTAEVLAFRVWTGNFYAMVPVRFDWAHGKWAEGEECYATDNGTLRERGCIMPIKTVPEPRSPDADTIYVHLLEAPDGNLDNSLNVGISPDSHPEFLDMMAIVQWKAASQRVECSFRNLWLRIRIEDKEGWVQGQQAFDALGLPLASPE